MTATTITIGSPTKCRSCQAPVMWANTEGGKVAPFEVSAEGRWVIENGKARYVGDARQLELGVGQPTHYSSHFSTCPQGDAWRKPRV